MSSLPKSTCSKKDSATDMRASLREEGQRKLEWGVKVRRRGRGGGMEGRHKGSESEVGVDEGWRGREEGGKGR